MSSVDQSLGRSGIALSNEDERLFPTSIFKTKSAFPGTSRLFLIVISIISAVLVPSRMLLSTGPPDDSSVFAYVGWAMKHGLMPYRDIWDHKGPLLYYVQYAGMSLWSKSTLGIGLLEALSFAITFFLIYCVVTSFASRFVSIVIAAISVAFVTHFDAGGNMTESWALLPLAAAQYVCWRWSKRPSQMWCTPLLGICFACIFWIRANMATYPAVSILILLYATWKREGLATAVKQLFTAALAALAISALIVAPLYHWGVFHEFVAAYFSYNAAYSGALSLSARYQHTSQLLVQLLATAIAILGSAGWALVVIARRHNRGSGELPSLYLQTLLWSLPVEVAGATLSGREFPHYLLPLFPTLAVLATCFVSEFEKQARTIPTRPVLLTALLLALSPLTLISYSGDFLHTTEAPRSDYLAVVHFIQHATTPSDKITIVGGVESAYITLLSKRLPASRFVYQYALIDANNPAAADQRQQFMCEIAQNRPAVIVSGNPLLGILCASPLECTLRNLQAPASGADYGYQSTLLPKLMQTVIASEYQPISDARFGPFRVLLRKDLSIPTHW